MGGMATMNSKTSMNIKNSLDNSSLLEKTRVNSINTTIINSNTTHDILS